MAAPVRVARVAGVIATVAAGVPLALAMPVLSPRTRTRAVRGWFRIVLRAAGVRLVVNGPRAGVVWTDERSDEGAERGGSGASATKHGVLVAANHISWLDVCAVLAIEPMPVVAKSEVRRWPVVGLLAARAGTLFIERGRLRRLPATVAEIAGTLRAGRNVLVFPEGTTRCGRTRGRLFPATFQAAVDADAAVRPLSLRYRLADGTPTTVAAFLADDTLPASLWRVTGAPGLVVEVGPGPLLPAAGATRRELAAATATALASHAALDDETTLAEHGPTPAGHGPTPAGHAMAPAGHAMASADQGSTQRHAPGRITQVRRRTGPEMSPSALT